MTKNKTQILNEREEIVILLLASLAVFYFFSLSLVDAGES